VHRLRPLLGLTPFTVFVVLFLVVPTLVVVIGALLDANNALTLANLRALTDSSVLTAFRRSILLSPCSVACSRTPSARHGPTGSSAAP
jgi:putative spermidine/putrescine transport system permease protein